jgi:hypothetical protein
MSKKPSVEHKYHPKKDRFDISIEHYSLGKKSEREQIILKILRVLGLNASPSNADAKKTKTKKQSNQKPLAKRNCR